MKPTTGRIVLYCIGKAHDGSPILRPADVLNDYPNLLVKLDGSNDERILRDAQTEQAAFLEARPESAGNRASWPPADEAIYVDLARTVGAAPREAECAARLAWRTSVQEGEQIGEWRWPPRDAGR